MGWLPEWKQRIEITIDKDDVDAALSDFPIMVYLSTSSGRNNDDVSEIFDELQADGNRKRIAITISDGLTQCYVEIEKWDDANEKAWLWVKVPSVDSATDTVLYLYYDILHADNTDYVGDTNSTPAENVWADGYFICHMKDDPDNAHIRDSSSYDADGTKRAANQPIEAAGDKTAYAQDFNGATPDYVEIAAGETQLDFTSEDFSIIIRILFDDLTANRNVLIRGLANTDGWRLEMDTLERAIFYTYQGAAAQVSLTANGSIVAGTPYTIGISRSGASVKVFRDGVDITSSSGTHIDPVTSARTVKIGVYDDKASNPFDGEIEFIGVFGGVNLTAAFHKAFDQSITDDLLAFGSEELRPQVLVNGVEVRIRKGSLMVDTRIEERSVASFDIEDVDESRSYQRGEPVAISDLLSDKIFGGFIANPEQRRMSPEGGLFHPVQCMDNHYLADKRRIAESYVGQTCGAIVTDIHTNYLADEGVTIGTIEAGPTLIEAVFNYVRASDALDALAEKAGKVWYIDQYGALFFVDRDTVTAPWNADGDDMLKGTAKISGGNALYRNRQYIRGGRDVTGAQVENFTGDGVTVAFALGYALNAEPTVTVGGAGQNMGVKGIDTTSDCYWAKGDPIIVFDGGSVPAGAAAIVVTYVGEYDVLVLVTDEDEIDGRKTIEGDTTTGFVDDMADEPKLDDKEAAFDAGEAKLARFGVDSTRFHYSTITPGLRPGQLQEITFAKYGVTAEEMLIESVIFRGAVSEIVHDIVAIQGPDRGSWAKYFERLGSQKDEVFEKLNVGADQILIILITKAETWEWTESLTYTIWACPVVALNLWPTLVLYPC